MFCHLLDVLVIEINENLLVVNLVIMKDVEEPPILKIWSFPGFVKLQSSKTKLVFAGVFMIIFR